MSFGKVEVIHETQFRNSALVAGMSDILIDELSHEIGLNSAANHELPAVILIEKLKSKISDATSVALNEHGSPQLTNTQESSHTPSSSGTQSTDTPIVSETAQTQSSTPTFITVSEANNSDFSFKSGEPYSLIDMSLIKVVPNGYAGGFLDRHLIYLIEDQNRVINLDTGMTTCQVTRRFSDFVALRNYLLTKFPFRCIPKLPAKRVQMFSDEAFLLERQRGLRRFLGIITRHHMYRADTVVQSFVYDQKDYYNLISDPKVTEADRERMLLTQIPSADALVRSNMKDAQDAVLKGQIESQMTINFLSQTKEQVKSLIENIKKESTIISKMSTILKSSEDVSGCFCPERCEGCVSDWQSRTQLSSKLIAVNETTENSTVMEFEEIVSKVSMLIDLFESFSDLLNRAKSAKHNDFEEIRKEIGQLESESEKKRNQPDGGAEAADRIRIRIDALKQQWDEQDTFNKFIQYSVFNEMGWIHGHKAIIKHLLDQLATTMTLKQRQWIATFEATTQSQ